MKIKVDPQKVFKRIQILEVANEQAKIKLDPVMAELWDVVGVNKMSADTKILYDETKKESVK